MMEQSSEPSTLSMQNGQGIEQEHEAADLERRENIQSEGISDGDEGERPVREKLKKTSIAGLKHFSDIRSDNALESSQNDLAIADAQTHSSEAESIATTNTRGRPAKKRSFDDLQNENSGTFENGSAGPTVSKSKLHKRMRSRDVQSSEEYSPRETLKNGPTSTVEEESDADAQRAPGGPGVLVEVSPEELDGEAGQATTDVDRDMVGLKNEDTREELVAEGKPMTVTTEGISEERDDPAMKSAMVSGTKKQSEYSDKDVEEKPRTSPAPFGSSAIKQGSGFANASSASPFGNISSASPFGSLGTVKSPPKQKEMTDPEVKPISDSAFTSSGLSAFASSEKSPFSAIGAKSPNAKGFGVASTGALGSPFSGFGGASPFTAKSTAEFGSLGGGFGSATGFGGAFGGSGGLSQPLGGVSGFGGASGSVTAFGGTDKTRKVFGAPEEDEDEDNADDDADDEAHEGDEEDGYKAVKEHHRLTEQQRTSGEEDEETLFSCRAKLYVFDMSVREWKERGIGTLKVNAKKLPEEDYLSTQSETPESKAERRPPRLIMRTDGVHRVILNTPILNGMTVGSFDGSEPTGKFMIIQGFEGDNPSTYQVKIGKEEVAKELYHRIKELQAEY